MHIHTIQLNIERLIGGTNHMDAVEFGAYMSLMICAYQSKNNLPDDDKRLARMAKCSPRVWSRIRPIIAEKWQIKDGFWSQHEVAKELEKYRTLSQKNKANALKKKETAKPVGKPKGESGTANINNNKQVTISLSKDKESSGLLSMGDGRSITVDDFCKELWGMYPSVGRRKGHKDKFFDQIKKALKKGVDHEEIRNGVANYAEYCTATGEYNRDAFRWAKDAEWRNNYTISKPHRGDRAQRAGDKAVDDLLSVYANEEGSCLALEGPCSTEL